MYFLEDRLLQGFKYPVLNWYCNVNTENYKLLRLGLGLGLKREIKGRAAFYKVWAKYNNLLCRVIML